VAGFGQLLRNNRDYRLLWVGQAVSEIGDHFNTIAVLSLSLRITGSGFGVGMVMIARLLPMVAAGPMAGVLLDRMDRRKVMIASDLMRAVVAAGHIALLVYPKAWLLYLLSALLMFASPFFTAGRSALLPSITKPDELHTANALTQTTAWLTLSIGTMLGGVSTMSLGYELAFAVNAASFLVSAWMIAMIRAREGGPRRSARGARAPWADWREGWAYVRRRPILFAITLLGIGWAMGGGAAQVLFTLYGEIVFKAGPAGVGIIWSFAGIGLVIGGLLGHRVGKRLSFLGYKRVLSVSLAVHGISYVLFAVMPTIATSLAFIALSRVAMGMNNVLNRTMMLTHSEDEFRGRVFATAEMLLNATMMASLAVAGWATAAYPIRTIGVIAGALSTSVAVFWIWADAAGKLSEE
jgi:MFS family permease